MSTLDTSVRCDRIFESARWPTTHTPSPGANGLVSRVAERTGVAPMDFGS